MPDHLIVIRSADTDYETQGRVRGSLDIPPCSAGLAEANAVAKRLAQSPPVALYAAPTACAAEAARIIGGRCGLAVKEIDLLANIDLGLWQGKLVEEIRRLQPRVHRQWQDDPWSIVPPEGEILDEARGRVEQALDRMAREIAAVKKIDDDQAVKELEEYLSKNAKRAPTGEKAEEDVAADEAA